MTVFDVGKVLPALLMSHHFILMTPERADCMDPTDSGTC